MTGCVKGLHHIAIICSNRENALKFYGLLGFGVTETRLRPERNDEIIMMSGHGVTLELFIDCTHPPRVTNPEAYGLRHLAFRVTDINRVILKLAENGFTPERLRRDSFTGEKMTFVKDPDGLPIELHE